MSSIVSTKRTKRRALAYLVGCEAYRYFLIFLLLALVVPYSAYSQDPSSDTAASDFLEYWSAYRLLEDNKNPYDPQEMRQVQAQVGKSGDPIMMWNPPWLPLLMEPILSGDLIPSSQVWRVLNIFFLITSIWIWLRIFEPHGWRRLEFGIIALLFPPIWNCLSKGQVGLFLLCIASFVALALINKRRTLAGFLAALLSIKPHLFVPFWTLLGCKALQQKRLSFVLGFVASFALLFSWTELRYPSALAQWIQTLTHQQSVSGVTAAIKWNSAAPSHMLQSSFAHWPSIALATPTLIFLIGLFLIFVWGRFGRVEIEERKRLVFLLSCSVAIAPLSWLFDYCLLLPGAFLVSRLGTLLERALLMTLLVGSCVFLAFFARFHSEFSWFPLSLIMLQYLSSRRAGGL
jgi:hypothetical protein